MRTENYQFLEKIKYVKKICLLFLFFLNFIQVQSQVKNIDSLTRSHFTNFSEVLSGYIEKKYSNSKIFFSEDRIYSMQILRVNDWTEYRLTKEILIDSLLKVKINHGRDSLIWYTGFYYSKFISHFVIDHVSEDYVNNRVVPKFFISCTTEEWARFYYGLYKSKKSSKLYFTLDVIDSNKKHQTIRCFMKYNVKKGFKRVVVVSKSLIGL